MAMKDRLCAFFLRLQSRRIDEIKIIKDYKDSVWSRKGEEGRSNNNNNNFGWY